MKWLTQTKWIFCKDVSMTEKNYLHKSSLKRFRIIMLTDEETRLKTGLIKFVHFSFSMRFFFSIHHFMLMFPLGFNTDLKLIRIWPLHDCNKMANVIKCKTKCIFVFENVCTRFGLHSVRLCVSSIHSVWNYIKPNYSWEC